MLQVLWRPLILHFLISKNSTTSIENEIESDDDIDDEMSELCEQYSPSILVVMHTLSNLLWNIGLVFAPKVSRV